MFSTPAPTHWYLILSAIVFAVGTAGVLLRRSLIILFMCIELLLNAVNLNTGEFAWREVFGDLPRVRENPALAGAKLPEKLGLPGARGGVIVTKGGIVFAGCGDTVLHAIDKSTGKDLWTAPLGRPSTGTRF